MYIIGVSNFGTFLLERFTLDNDNVQRYLPASIHKSKKA